MRFCFLFFWRASSSVWAITLLSAKCFFNNFLDFFLSKSFLLLKISLTFRCVYWEPYVRNHCWFFCARALFVLRRLNVTIEFNSLESYFDCDYVFTPAGFLKTTFYKIGGLLHGPTETLFWWLRFLEPCWFGDPRRVLETPRSAQTSLFVMENVSPETLTVFN